MKTKLLSMTLALAFGVSAAGCLPYFRANRDRVGPVFDRNAGSSEMEIYSRFGQPEQVLLYRADEKTDELRYVLRTMVPKPETMVKELYYRKDRREHIFWLTEQPNGDWRVFSDADIPPG